MATRPNWHRVADRLASRLFSHLGCPEPAHQRAPDPAGCPFCDDMAAYQEYVAAVWAARVLEEGVS